MLNWFCTAATKENELDSNGTETNAAWSIAGQTMASLCQMVESGFGNLLALFQQI